MNPVAALSDADRLAFILRVLSACNSFDGPGADSIWWRTDGDYAPITFLVGCNDEFSYATADCEDLTPANVEAFEQAIADTIAATQVGIWGARGCSVFAPMLFCARTRKMRPLPGAYPVGDDHAGVRALLDACGPVRT